MVQIKWLKSAKNDLKEIYDFVSLDSKDMRSFKLKKFRIKQKF